MELPTTTQQGYSDFDREPDLEDESISVAEQIRRGEEEFKRYLIEESYCFEPFLHHLRKLHCPYSIPACFKCHHPDDDSLMESLGKSQLPRPLEEDDKQVIESLTKRVVVDLIWRDTSRMEYIWGNEKLHHLHTSIIKTAAFLVYFLYPQTELYRIGHSRAVHEELDELQDQIKEEPSFDALCTVINQQTSAKNKYNFVTEDYIADMIYPYPNFPDPRQTSLMFLSFPFVDEKDQDKLYKDIAEVVNDLEPPPFEPDEYTHWMMMFLRGDAVDVVFNIISKFIDENLKLTREDCLYEPLFMLVNQMMTRAKFRLKDRLLSVVQPLIKICKPVGHAKSQVIIEIVEVAELRRTAVGDQFIGRSHLLWAFYKLGYALPYDKIYKKLRNVRDQGHPPYHIYIAARKFAKMFGDECVNLLHFISAVISMDFGLDGQVSASSYHLRDLQALDKEEFVEEHTGTMRPCPAVEAIIEEMRVKYDN